MYTCIRIFRNCVLQKKCCVLICIDFFERSLKAVLLHNRNKYPSIAIAHSVCLKESYDNIEFLLEAVKYN